MTVATDGRLPTVQHRMTLAEYLDYDHGTDTWYELEDGRLVDMSGENPLNPRIAIFVLGYLLQQMNVPLRLLVIGHQIEVRSSYATCRQPDLMVHTVESDVALVGDEKALYLDSPSPLLVMEVASSSLTDSKSRKRDYEHKPREYADRGIPEMWIVDPDRLWVQVGTLTGGVYKFETFMGEDTIVSSTFPALNLTAAIVLSAGR
jgi:Uma2 family endonuclease